ncbi:MAG: hypothetical protein OEX12_15805 [Gammaproteobacteria bacterium]|nr:hypothetical protein [Gammaproteobacteria bacterium]
MSETIEIIHRQTQNSLAVESRASIFRIPTAMGKAYSLIRDLLEAKGVIMDSPPYTLYKYVDWDASANSKGVFAFFKIRCTSGTCR